MMKSLLTLLILFYTTKAFGYNHAGCLQFAARTNQHMPKKEYEDGKWVSTLLPMACDNHFGAAVIRTQMVDSTAQAGDLNGFKIGVQREKSSLCPLFKTGYWFANAVEFQLFDNRGHFLTETFISRKDCE